MAKHYSQTRITPRITKNISVAFILLYLVSLADLPLALGEGITTFPLGSTVPDIAMTGANGSPMSLTKYFESNRILLVFVPDDCIQNAEGYFSQLTRFSNALKERAVQVVVVVTEHSSLLKKELGENIVVATQSDYVATIAAPNAEAAPLSILIGKDKTVKLRERQFIPFKAIISTIDAMPMRKDELKQKSEKPSKDH